MRYRGREERAHKAAGRRNHRAPSDRPIHSGQLFHYSDLCHRVELEAAVNSRDCHAECAQLPKFLDQAKIQPREVEELVLAMVQRLRNPPEVAGSLTMRD